MGFTVELVGPGMYVLVVALLVDAVAAVFLVSNALRRPDSDYAGVPEGRWFYVIPQAFYAVLYVIAQIPFLTKLVPWADAYALAAPLMVAQQLAYLLRVVFPTHGRLEARLEASSASRPPTASDTDPPVARSTPNA